jgi:hypothetical protein
VLYISLMFFFFFFFVGLVTGVLLESFRVLVALCEGILYHSLVGLIGKALSQTLPRVKSVQGKVVVCVCLSVYFSFPFSLVWLPSRQGIKYSQW